MLRDQHVAGLVVKLEEATNHTLVDSFAAQGLGYVALAAAAGQSGRMADWAMDLGRAEDAARARI